MSKSIVATLILPMVVSAAIPVLSDDKTKSGPKTNVRVGPATEKRFPPLKLPKGFKATLFACDPLVEYPSVIALGPKTGTLFVAHDYVTGLGIKIVRRDEVRLLADTDGDGYADKSKVFAGGFNSIQGLAYYDGSVFVMHAPLLTALKDTNGDGVADKRRDIVSGLGLKPENNPNRLHCANGVVAGHDGWLYLALGDRGCDVKRPEGDRLLFQQGGILRCRPDGRDLHVFAGGMRNIYDVALDEELNVFVRDNENDGGDYMIRVCHSFFGADHGYPYLYYERPDEAMRPLADLGRGSSAGGTSYLETAFPKEFRESLFFCEWGRAVVRYRKSRAGSGFAAMSEVDFAAGADNDPYGFKPTDLVVDYNGSLLISDWGDGQRPKRGRGRIYRITNIAAGKVENFTKAAIEKLDDPQLIALLNADSYYTRVAAQLEIQRGGKFAAVEVRRAFYKGLLNSNGRLHAIWILARLKGQEAAGDLLAVAKNAGDARTRAQAVKALADLFDPVLARHQLAAGRGDEKAAGRLAGLVTKQQDHRVVLEVLVALARLRWSAAPDWLRKQKLVFGKHDALAHAALQLLRRADNWPAVLKLLDEPPAKDPKQVGLRTLALRALANRAETTVVDGVINRLKSDSKQHRRREYVDLLARVHKKPAVWKYWGFRPAPRPADSVGWERTQHISEVLDRALADSDFAVRAFALKRMRREQIPIRLKTLTAWLRQEKRAEHVVSILDAMNGFEPARVRDLLEEVVRRKSLSAPVRVRAFSSFAGRLDAKTRNRLLGIAMSLEDGPVLAEVLRELGRRKTIPCEKLLLAKLKSNHAAVRAASIAALGDRGAGSASNRVVELLMDADVRVRRAAAIAAGTLKVANAALLLRRMSAHSDRELCRASLVSLKQLGDSGAVRQAETALKSSETQLAALSYLESFGDERQTSAFTKLAASSRSTEITQAVIRGLENWRSRKKTPAKARLRLQAAVAAMHGQTGAVIHWRTFGPLSKERAGNLTDRLTSAPLSQNRPALETGHTAIGSGTDSAVSLRPVTAGKKPAGSIRIAVADVFAGESAQVEVFTGSDGPLQIWLNGRRVFQRNQSTAYRADADRFDAKLTKGFNRLIVRIDSQKRVARFHLRFRTKNSKAEHERLIAAALRSSGSAVRGREIFVNAKKSQCVNCHRLDGKGSRIGPDLTGIGSRFSRIHLIESILQPSRTIAPSYATLVVALSSGRIITGVKVSETAKTTTLGDNQGKLQTFAKNDVEETRTQSKSTMPEGLEKRLTEREFVDLLAFLQSLKKRRTGNAQPKR